MDKKRKSVQPCSKFLYGKVLENAVKNGDKNILQRAAEQGLTEELNDAIDQIIPSILQESAVKEEIDIKSPRYAEYRKFYIEALRCGGVSECSNEPVIVNTGGASIWVCDICHDYRCKFGGAAVPDSKTKTFAYLCENCYNTYFLENDGSVTSFLDARKAGIACGNWCEPVKFSIESQFLESATAHNRAIQNNLWS